MPRTSILPGKKFEYNGKVYLIEKCLYDNKVLTQDVTFGGSKTFTRTEIATYLKEGTLRFGVDGKNIKSVGTSQISTAYVVEDFNMVSDINKEIAIARYKIISPLLKLPNRTLMLE
ncbi:hypothetical protein JCM14036_01500 [Desulfotomaculum defluvii]